MRIASKILYRVALGALCSIALAFDHLPAEAAKDRSEEVAVYVGKETKHACRPHGPRRSDRRLFLDEVRDLYVCVVWYGLAGTYVERLAFFLPDGHLYQVLTVPFSTPGASGPAEVEVDGRLVEVIEGQWAGKDETGVVTVLPVAGTYITQRNLVGTWRVDVSLNDQLIKQVHITLKARE